MTTRMLINATAPNELRIAIVEEGELVELDIESAEQSSLRGNIYKGVIHNVEPSLAAAFVDIGSHKQGFLPFSEVSEEQYYREWNSPDDPRINDVLRRGQEIIVQVAKDAIGEKGVTLTTYLSIAGRYVVLMPGGDASGISRKIDDDKVRRKIRALASKLVKPEGCGFIIRTAGLGQKRQSLQKDLDNVGAIHQKVISTAAIARAPSILYAEPDLISRTLRDFFSDEIDEVWIDNREEYEAARSYFHDVMPDYLERLHWYQDPIPIYAFYHVEEQIESTFERVVSLPSGGSIVIDETEALVAIDVNSGKTTSERGHEETVFKTNCEAAEEVARQLKLRDLGGIVVIDFIDMELAKNERSVERTLADAAQRDKARYKIARINSKGLCVLTRQRIRQGMRKAFQRRCEVCSGTGWRRTAESHGLSLLRRVETRLAQGGVGEVRVFTHRETAEDLLNLRRNELVGLERQYQCRVHVFARAEMDRGKDEVTYLSHGEILQEITERLPPREERRKERAQKQRGKTRRSRTDRGEGEGRRGEGEGRRAAGEGRRAAGEGRRAAGEGRRAAGEGRRARGEARLEAPAQARASEEALEQAPAQAVGNGGAAAEAPAEPHPSGVTFTGRPSPELLAKLKAERRARMSQRARPKDAAQETMSGNSDLPGPSGRASERGSTERGEEGPPPQLAAVPDPAGAEAGSAEERKGILDRLFGTR